MPMSEENEATLRALMGETFTSLIADVARSRRLLREAVPGLVTSFNALRDDLMAQSNELLDVSGQLNGSGAESGFLSLIRGMLTTFMVDLVGVSHNSMQLVERIDSLNSKVADIVNHINEVEWMAKETRLIAFNAHVEAVRATNAGKTFRVVADEVKRLADRATLFSGKIRDVARQAETELQAAKTSTETLASHDLNTLVDVQQQVIRTVEKLDQTNARVSESVVRFQNHVEVAIRSLQFDDLMTQLLTSVEGRLGHLRDVWEHWLLAHQTDSAEGWRDFDVMLARLRPTLERSTSVQQASLGEGTTELF